MSVVYEVAHVLTKERLALKALNGSSVTMDSISLARFRREARLSALMRSEYVVRVLDADIAPELGDAPYLVMDLLQGSDLATLAGDTPQPAERVIAWFRHVARALDLAHHYGVVHRDLKPENLFLTTAHGEPLIKVLDFGVASIPLLEGSTGTATGGFVGTPLFMSPEQASGAEVGSAADVWSVGMSVYRLLNARDYWEAANVTLLLAKIVYEEVEPPSRRGFDRGPEFDEWFLKSCARDPSKRWRSIGEQIEALAAACGCPVEEIPPLTIPADTLSHDDADDFEIQHRSVDRANSLGGSFTSIRVESLPKRATVAAAVAFMGAAAAVAMQFTHRAPSMRAQAAEARQATNEAVKQPATPEAAGTSSETRNAPPQEAAAPSEAANVPGVAAWAVASTVRSDRSRSTRKAAKVSAPPEDKMTAPSAAPAVPTSVSSGGFIAPRPRDPLADPD